MTNLAPQSDDLDDGFGRPRFSLCALMLAVTAAGCLFGVMVAVGPLWSMGLLFVLCLVVAHVAGNSLGTKLRDQSTRRSAAEHRAASPSAQSATSRQAAMKLQLAAPSQLAERAHLNRLTAAVTFSGALVGAMLGGVGSAFLYPAAGTPALGLGVVSAAVLGSFVGFAVSSFVSVAGAAWGEALRDPAAGRFSQRPPR